MEVGASKSTNDIDHSICSHPSTGGFAFGHPWVDDADNAYYAQNHGLCVVSINYRKAPEAPFPIPVQDCALLIKAVLDDESLPVDLSRGVAIAGYSAGGNLALTAPMLDGLHKRFKGVVAFYPAADVGRKTADRIKTSISPPGRKDILIDGAPGFNWAYVPRGQNLKDPLLAPVYAERNMLPEKLFVMGCEYDILCQEAEDFAEHMAEAEKGNKEDLGEGRVGWKIGGLTWENLLGLEHGFNQRLLERDPVLKERWAKATELMRKRVGEWLWEEVYDQ